MWMGALAWCGMALAADQAPAPEGLEKLKVFSGAWRSESENFDTIFSHAAKVSSLLANECSVKGNFYVCDQSVNGQSRVLLVFAHAGGDTYGVTYIPADGGHAITGALIVVDNTWTYPGQQSKLGQITYFRTVDIFTDADTIEFREEFSTDNQHWTLMAKGHETRVK
jgi:hypothetical protein